MKSLKLWMLSSILIMGGAFLPAQSNLLENPSFEAVWPLGHYPRLGENLFDRCPIPWMDFNPGDNERWFTDSLSPVNSNLPNPLYQNGFSYLTFTNVGAPWEMGDSLNPTVLQEAHAGNGYIGIDLKSDLFTREGIQTEIQGCPLNSGNYTASLWYSRTYPSDEIQFNLYLAEHSSSRKKKIAEEIVGIVNYVAGTWIPYTVNFAIDLQNEDERFLDWFNITGQTAVSSSYKEYIFFDDVRLYRPCDEILECVPTHGQICPSVAILQAPGDLIRVSDISTASDLHLKIYVSNSQIIKDTVYHNANGLPDFRFTRLALPLSTAASTYHYDLEITNACGGFKKTGNIQVLDTAAYNPITPYLDTTANWTGVPIPCCLSSLTLQNMQIVGDVSYIVRDEIIVQNGVTLAPNSHVTLQAGNVTELSNVEFDGTNSTLEIVEIPCPNRMACGQGCGGGAMVMDAGEFVIPPQPTTESHATVEGNVAPAELKALTQPLIETETRLWAYPNPFEKEFRIGLALPVSMTCTVVVNDIQMRPVRTVMQEKEMQAGTHQLSVDLGGLPAGVYLVQLQAGGRSYHQRMVKQ